MVRDSKGFIFWHMLSASSVVRFRVNYCVVLSFYIYLLRCGCLVVFWFNEVLPLVDLLDIRFVGDDCEALVIIYLCL